MTDSFTEELARATRKPTRPPTRHVRCCRPTVTKGLCGTARPPRDVKATWGGTPDSCLVCADLWDSGHWVACPQDSKYWKELTG